MLKEAVHVGIVVENAFVTNLLVRHHRTVDAVRSTIRDGFGLFRSHICTSCFFVSMLMSNLNNCGVILALVWFIFWQNGTIRILTFGS